MPDPPHTDQGLSPVSIIEIGDTQYTEVYNFFPQITDKISPNPFNVSELPI